MFTIERTLIYLLAFPSLVSIDFSATGATVRKIITAAREGLKFYEAGMDLGVSDDPEESFRFFQGRIIDEYEKMIPEFGLTVVDATLPVEIQQAQVRQIAKTHLERAKNLRVRP